VVWAEQAIQAVQYNVVRYGGFSMTTEVKDGETPEQAMDRAYAYLDRFAKKNWPKALGEHLASISLAAQEARAAASKR